MRFLLGNLHLVVALADTPIDMKKLTKYLGYSSGTLRFGSEDILFETLGVREGCESIHIFPLITRFCSCDSFGIIQRSSEQESECYIRQEDGGG